MSARLGIDLGDFIAYIDCSAIMHKDELMASLTIRNIPEDTKRRFRQRAAAHGRSMEEEARQLLIEAVGQSGGKPSMFELLYEASRPGLELPIPPRTPARIPDFGSDDEV